MPIGAPSRIQHGQAPRNGQLKKEVSLTGSASKQQVTKKKFLHSVEGLEGVSLDDGSDDENVVEESLMQLQSSATDEETEDDTDNTLIDPHMLVLQPISTEDTNVIMEEDKSLIANQNLDPFGSNFQPTSTKDVSNADQNLTLTGLSTQPTSVTDVSTLHLEGEPTLFEFIEQASNDFFGQSTISS